MAASASAGTIVDVSGQSRLQMNPGDQLFFPISNLSLHSTVTSLEFQFVSELLGPEAGFSAELTSRDGTTAIALPDLRVSTGVFIGSGYQGPISVISGTLALPGTLSPQIFENSRATLVLADIGPSVTLDLPGYRLPQDMLVDLSAGASNAGAFVSAALYEDPPPATAPEPASWMLGVAGGAMLAPFWGALKQISHPRIP